MSEKLFNLANTAPKHDDILESLGKNLTYEEYKDILEILQYLDKKIDDYNEREQCW